MLEKKSRGAAGVGFTKSFTGDDGRPGGGRRLCWWRRELELQLFFRGRTTVEERGRDVRADEDELRETEVNC